MKKILVGLSAVALAVASVPLFAAFEAHVINVTAKIENALQVDTTPITFGTVFPEERLVKGPIRLAMSESFLGENRVDDIRYVIKQKPKCQKTDGTYVPVETETLPDGTKVHHCPLGSTQLPLLCPYLSKTDADPEDGNDGPNIPPLHSMASTTGGILTKIGQDTSDLWAIDLLVPCFRGQCAQDNVIPPEYQLNPADESKVFGCDLWVEVTGISPTP